MKMLIVIAVLMAIFAPAAAQEVELVDSRLTASASLPKVVREVWVDTPDQCSVGRNEEHDLIADINGTLVRGSIGNDLYILPCGAPGAYNSSEIVIAHSSELNQARILAIPYIGEDGPSALIIGPGLHWDVDRSVLRSYYREAGIGNCGGSSSLKWDGKFYSNFTLVEQHMKTDCKSPIDPDVSLDDWPKVWPIE